MTPRREYVFSRLATIHDVKAHLEERLRKELASLQPDSLLSRSVDDVVNEIVARYTMHVPVLDREGKVEMPRQESQMEVPAFNPGSCLLRTWSALRFRHTLHP